MPPDFSPAAPARAQRKPSAKRRLGGQLARYRTFATWLARDVAGRYGRRLVGLVAANALGLALHAAAVSLGYFYARTLESGKALTLLGRTVEPRGSVELLLGTALAATALVIVAALLVMRARVGAATLARDYTDFCTRRAYMLATWLPSALSPYASAQFTRPRLHRIAVADAVCCGTGLRLLILMSLPAGTMVVALGALFLLDVTLTAIVLAVLAASLVQLYRLSVKAAQLRSELEEHVQESYRERRALNDRIALSPLALHEADASMLRLVAPEVTRSLALASERQRSALEQAQMVARFVFGAALFLVLVVRGGAMLQEAGNWSALLAYLAALGFFAGAFAKVARIFTNVNRLYPGASRYFRFVADAMHASGARAPAAGSEIALEAPSLIGGSGRLDLPPGARVAVVLPQQLDRYATAPVVAALRCGGAALTAPPHFVSPRLNPAGLTLRELTQPAQYPREALIRDLEAVGAADVPTLLSPDVERPLTKTEAQALGSRNLFLIMALAAARAGVPVVLLDARGLAELSGAQCERLFSLYAATGAVLTVYPVADRARIGAHGESALVAVDEQRVLGWAPMAAFTARDDAVERALAALQAAAPAQEGALGAENLDDEESL